MEVSNVGMAEKDTPLRADANDSPGTLVPVTIASIIAVLGIAGMFFIHIGPGSAPEGRGNGMISAANAFKAGATIIPSVPESSIAPTPPDPVRLYPASGPAATGWVTPPAPGVLIRMPPFRATRPPDISMDRTRCPRA